MTDTSRHTRITELDVERINVVQPDGTVRLVISNKDRFPAAVINGKELPRQGMPSAGFLFYNDQGVECGGLAFGGMRDQSGHQAGAALMLDAFEQDQVIGLMVSDENGERSYGLNIWDRPKKPLAKWMEVWEAFQAMPEGPEKTARMQDLQDQGDFGAQRMFIGRNRKGESQVVLNDSRGRPRIRMLVDQSDMPRIEFLDGEGKVTFSLPPE